MWVGCACVFDETVGSDSVKSEFNDGGCCLSPAHLCEAFNVARVSRTATGVTNEQKIYASHESGAQERLSNIFVLIRRDSSYGKEVRVESVLLLFRCLTNK